MSDMLLDDVNSLLDGDFGDDRILKQIARACKNNEVISNYERNYVQKLAEQHLGKKPLTNKKPETITPEIPRIEIPKPEPLVTTQLSQPNNHSKSKNPKLFLGFGGIAVVIIIATAFLLSNDVNPSESNITSEIKIELSVQTDLSSYAKSDLISINGVSQNSNIVNLSILNQNNDLVWAEQVSVKSDGRYSTLAIADGEGWENSGTYNIKVEDGTEIKSIKFTFNS
ncbi:hypothetical protein NMSP_0237 [Candidatus Nitrosomarinus catalina]|uniref:Uncharacterized protein n=1 Tax=Candidatus Nitrosomarinus catalinensis TaxID=1898749 RepID=A0A2Z2HI75_9ARCH|nr:hypothetical protein [Candidatus Nitrosomarinus catalina]ARS63867.1 hypothetical protein NMSP_0237 [Candidatus Nitrosomarinus catalina]